MKVILNNLEGVSRENTYAVFVHTAEDVEELLSKNDAVTAAGDNGAFNIWKDDNGKIRCQAYCHYISIGYKEYESMESIAEVVGWAKEMFKIIK